MPGKRVTGKAFEMGWDGDLTHRWERPDERDLFRKACTDIRFASVGLWQHEIDETYKLVTCMKCLALT